MVADNGHTTPITVLFVEKTPGGELAKRLREAEAEVEKITGDRIKIVERAGVMLKSLLHKANPWEGAQCGRGDCLVCRQDNGKSCRQRNVTYTTECLKCQEKGGKKSQYLGESARTSYERGLEHLKAYDSLKEDSHMAKHWLEDHQGEDRPEFKMRVARKHTSALVRQVHEAVIIEMATEDKEINVLNSKGEYNRCQLPRLGVRMGQKCIEEEEPASEEDFEEELMLEDRKRQGEHGEQTQPPGKRKRSGYNKHPGIKQPEKRSWIEDPSEKNRGNKKSRIEKTEERGLLPTCTKTTKSAPPEKLECSTKNVDRKCENPSKIPTLLHFNFTKTVKCLENGPVLPNGNENENCTSKPTFENLAVSGTVDRKNSAETSPTPTYKQLMIKSEYKAHPNTSTVATTTQSSRKPKIKRGRKLVLPNFSFKKISEHYAKKQPPEGISNN